MSEWKESRREGHLWRESSIDDRIVSIMANPSGIFNAGIVECADLDDYLQNWKKSAADFMDKANKGSRFLRKVDRAVGLLPYKTYYNHIEQEYVAFHIEKPFIVHEMKSEHIKGDFWDFACDSVLMMAGLTGIKAPVSHGSRSIFTLEQDKSQLKGYMFFPHVNPDVWFEAYKLQVGDKVEVMLSYPRQGTPPHAEIYFIKKQQSS